MYDIEELEKKWLKYRRRKLTIIASSVIFTISLVGGISYFILNSSRGDKLQKTEVVKKDTVSKDEDIIVKRKDKRAEGMNVEVPSMKKDETQKSASFDNEEMASTAQSETETRATKPKPKLDIVISEPKNRSVIKEIQKRFQESKNYDDAIYLAEYYYSRKDYKKAGYWAMQANIVDSIPEDSWMIFAKAKAKSGHRVEALKVLNAYYNKTGSTNALELIDTIRKNKNF